MHRLLSFLTLLLLAGCDVANTSSTIETDEHVVFFRSAGWLNESNQEWHLPVHGWIYEPQDNSARNELIYRAYDGLEGMWFPLQDRAGRKTLSAEDLLDFALDTNAFTPAAIFSLHDGHDSIVFGEDVRAALIASYR